MVISIIYRVMKKMKAKMPPKNTRKEKGAIHTNKYFTHTHKKVP